MALLAFLLALGVLTNLSAWVRGDVSQFTAVVWVVAALLLVVATAETLLERRRAPVLRIGPAGLTVRGQRTVAWDEVATVRITGTKPRWSIGGGRRAPVVAFVPGDARRFPSLSQAGWIEVPWARPLSRRQYGTDLVVAVRFVDVSLDDLLAAVRRHSDLPVTYLR